VDWGDPPLARNSLSSILSGFAQPAQPTPSFFSLAKGAVMAAAFAARSAVLAAFPQSRDGRCL